jgi:RecA/RadA recombinase
MARAKSEDSMDKKRAERLKRIGAMCKKFNDSKWGGEHKDAVQYVGGEGDYSIKALPTGSRGLDEALGVGGWPYGRICELYGGESGGKCLTADTYVYGANGLMTVGEVFEKNGFVPSTTSREVAHAYPLVDETGKLENTTHFHWNYKKPVNLMKTAMVLFSKQPTGIRYEL